MPNIKAIVSKMKNSERSKPVLQATVIEAECEFVKNDPSWEDDLNELKAKIISLQKENFSKDKDHRIALHELRETKTLLEKNKERFETALEVLKQDKDSALSDAMDMEKKLDKLNEIVDSFKEDISEKDMQQEAKMREMEEMRLELATWKECYDSAVEACRADAEAKIEAVKMEKDKAIVDTERLKAQLKEANAEIASLKQEIKVKEQEHEKTLVELHETKIEHARKIEEFEKALKECKAEVEMALQICKEDADAADKTLRTWKEQRDAAVTEAESLRKQISAMKKVLSLEDQVALSDVEQQRNMREIQLMRKELLKSKDEFETALRSCEEDARATEIALQACMKEKESALLDARAAIKQLQKVEAMLNSLETEKEREKKSRETSWWKRLLFGFWIR